jgi:hypothetical protein
MLPGRSDLPSALFLLPRCITASVKSPPMESAAKSHKNVRLPADSVAALDGYGLWLLADDRQDAERADANDAV